MARPLGAPKLGGRKKGTPNKASTAAAKKAQEIAAAGITPLEYLLSVVHDENEDRPVRVDAAKAAAPYVHPKLAQVVHKGADDQPLIPSRIEIVIVGTSN